MFPSRLDALIDLACSRYGDAPALLGEGERYTYAELAKATEALSAQLGPLALERDEPVLVQVRNRPLDVAAWHAVWRAGAVVVPVHADVPPPVFQELRERTGARFLVRGSERYAVSEAWQVGSEGCVSRLAEKAPAPRPLLKDAALVVFTSGSTGRPKGVVLSHAQYAGKLATNQERIPFAQGERTLLVLQLTFSFGQWVTLLTLATGGQLHMAPSFHPARSLEQMARDEIHRVAAVPTMMRAWLSHPEAAGPLAKLAELGRPALLIAGGEPLSAALGTAFRAKMPRTGIADVFGLTETNTSDFILPPGEYDRRAGSIGWPNGGVTFRLADENGPVKPGTPGELQLRTDFRMRGYFDDPATTDATFDGEWLKTGDVGLLRDDGTVELVGRAKDLIVRGGNKISPLEIEAALSSHPGVEAALAAGVPDALMGERVHVMVVLKKNDAVATEELRRWAAGRLEKYKVPDQIHFVNELPLGRTGKADRATLRTLVSARS